MDFERIKRLVALVEQHRLAELTIEEEDLTITVKAEAATSPGAAHPVCEAEAHAAQYGPEMGEVEAEEDSELTGEHLMSITSPMIGVFYRCPSPDSPPYIEVGEHIEVGQTIGLIEAMKVYSEVPSELAGRVVSVSAQNAKLVQQGDVLTVIDTSAVSEPRMQEH
jgi:acetyl-CoA carboxylase biotin carboxyl carrier protein